MSHGARGLAKASTAALVIAGVGGATGAQAAVPSVPDVTLEYTCKYPIVDKQPLSIKVSSNIPTKAVLRVNQPAFQINAVATAGGDTARAINTLNAYSIQGSSEAFADLEFPDGFIQEDLFVPLVVEPWIRPSSAPVTGNLVLTAKGDTPSVQLEPVGNALIRLDRITLNLVAKGQTGNIINVRKLTTDFAGNPVPVDTTPDDFNVYCQLNDGQSNLIATIEVVNSLNTPPGKVAGLKSTAKSTTSVDLAWDAASDPDAGDSIKEYRVFQGANLVKTVAAPATSVKVDGLTPNTDYSFTVVAVDTAGPEAGPASDALPVKTDPIPDPVNTAPGKVAGLKSTAKSTTSVDLAWDAASDPDAGDSIKEYRVFQGATQVKTVAAPATSVKVDGLTPNTDYSFTVVAVDNGGPVAGPASDALSVKTDAIPDPVNTAPTVPTALKVGAVTSSTIALSWTASTDDAKVAGYNVYSNGTKIGTSATPSFTATGLAPSTKYTFTVDAFDEPGLTSAKSAGVDGTTGPKVEPGVCPEGFACQAYTLAGSTQLNTLTKGSLPLKGGIDAALDPSNGKFTADLVLNPTSGRLTALSFLPITVKVAFAPSGKTTGTLDDANILRSKSLVRIKITEVKLFGAIPLAGGNGCQTKSLSEINLTSTKAFEIFKGGTLKGTYAISDLNGCGALNGLVSPLTAGKGNTISLDLTPKA